MSPKRVVGMNWCNRLTVFWMMSNFRCTLYSSQALLHVLEHQRHLFNRHITQATQHDIHILLGSICGEITHARQLLLKEPCILLDCAQTASMNYVHGALLLTAWNFDRSLP